MKTLFGCVLLTASACISTAVKTVYIDDVEVDRVYHSAGIGDFEEPTALVYRFLTTVRQDVYLSDTANLVSIKFPKLVSIKEMLYCYNNTLLEEADFPKVTELSTNVGNGGIFVQENPSLRKVNFEKLVTIRRSMWFGRNEMLDLSQSFCSLRDVLPRIPDSKEWCRLTTVTVQDNGSPDHELCGGAVPASQPCVIEMDDVELGYIGINGRFNSRFEEGDPVTLVYTKLQRVRYGITVEQTSKIAGLVFPKLTSVGQQMFVSRNTGLREVVLPKLTELGGWLTLSYHPLLSVADIPNLVVGNVGLTLRNNPKLDLRNVLCALRVMFPPTGTNVLCRSVRYMIEGNLNDNTCTVPTLLPCPPKDSN